jgi:hypothetical protein
MATNVDRTTVEQALERGFIWALMGNGRYWRLRRNGATKTWKTRPNEFRIPVKAGLKSCGYLDHDSAIGLGNPQDRPNFVVTSHDPNTVKPASFAERAFTA